jgi:hypothetical protein
MAWRQLTRLCGDLVGARARSIVLRSRALQQKHVRRPRLILAHRLRRSSARSDTEALRSTEKAFRRIGRPNMIFAAPRIRGTPPSVSGNAQLPGRSSTGMGYLRNRQVNADKGEQSRRLPAPDGHFHLRSCAATVRPPGSWPFRHRGEIPHGKESPQRNRSLCAPSMAQGDSLAGSIRRRAAWLTTAPCWEPVTFLRRRPGWSH